MLVEIAFESLERRVQHRGGVEVPAIHRLGFDRAARALDQAVGPGMIRLGEAVPDLAPPTALGERMYLGGAGSTPTPIAPQREFPSVVGQHPIEVKRIELLAVREKRHGAGHVPCRGNLHRHHARRPIDGHKEIPPGSAQAWQRKGIDGEEPRGTGAESTMRSGWAGPQRRS